MHVRVQTGSNRRVVRSRTIGARKGIDSGLDQEGRPIHVLGRQLDGQREVSTSDLKGNGGKHVNKWLLVMACKCRPSEETLTER